jgi:hypothetical protein
LDYSVYRALFVYCIKGTYCIYNDEISTPQLSYREGTLDNLDIAYPGSKVLTDVEKTKAVASGAIFGTRSVPDLSNSNGETGTQIFRTGEAVVQIACVSAMASLVSTNLVFVDVMILCTRPLSG